MKTYPKVYVVLKKSFFGGWKEVDWDKSKAIAEIRANQIRRKGSKARVVFKTPKLWREQRLYE